MGELDVAKKCGSSLSGLSLPVVSIIVVNYNYGRFLAEAVESVFGQTYSNIECIIVDNASTDNSSEVISQLQHWFPAIKYLQREENSGQNIAARDGFDASQGEYIVFLDADDFLFPAFVATHIFVHLSLRIPVGLTSSDMVQTCGSRVVVSTCACVSDYVTSGKGRRPNLLRRIDDEIQGFWGISAPDSVFDSRLHFVPPYQASSWPWAPTSGNCFRRDALRLFLNNPNLSKMRGGTDAYLLRGVSLLTGGVLIDMALAAYRVHGDNLFSKHADLHCMIAFQRDAPVDFNLLAKKLLIDHLIENVDLFLAKSIAPERFVDALAALDSAWPSLPGAPTYAIDKLIAEKPEIVGKTRLIKFVNCLKRLKFAPSINDERSDRSKTASRSPKAVRASLEDDDADSRATTGKH